MRWKKFLKPCVGLSVGKQDCVKLQRIVNRVKVVREFVWKSKSGRFGVRLMVAGLSFRLAYNGLQLQEVGDFGDENCLPQLDLICSTKLLLTTEPPISYWCCYRMPIFFVSLFLFVCPCFNLKGCQTKLLCKTLIFVPIYFY